MKQKFLKPKWYYTLERAFNQLNLQNFHKFDIPFDNRFSKVMGWVFVLKQSILKLLRSFIKESVQTVYIYFMMIYETKFLKPKGYYTLERPFDQLILCSKIFTNIIYFFDNRFSKVMEWVLYGISWNYYEVQLISSNSLYLR